MSVTGKLRGARNEIAFDMPLEVLGRNVREGQLGRSDGD